MPRRDGGPVETDGRTIWRRFADALAPVPGHAVAALAGADARARSSASPRRCAPTPPTRSTTRSPSGWPSPSSGRGRCSSGSTSRCWPPPSRRWTTWPRTPSWPPTAGRPARVITTFRPDDVVDMEWAGWADAGGPARRDHRRGHRRRYAGYLDALRPAPGGVHRAPAPPSARPRPPDRPHPRRSTRPRRPRCSTGACAARRPRPTPRRSGPHMLVEFARMSLEDGLVMQLHPGAVRNHNRWLHDALRPRRRRRHPAGDRLRARRCAPLLDAYGNDPRLRLVLYTLDETTFTRELAPLAGGYAALLPRRAVVVPGLARRRCAGSARRSPRRPASTTPPASSTTPGRSAPSRSATTWPAGSTPASWPGWSPSTGCRSTRPPRPSPTWPTTCPSGSSDWRTDDDHDHHRRRRARRPLPDRGGRRRLGRDQPGRLLGHLRRAAHRRRRSPAPGFTFTNGRGNEITCAAVRALAHHVVGPDAGRDRRRAGGVLALAHRRRAAALARPGEGRHPHGGRRAGQRGVGPAGQGWPASRCGGCWPRCRPRSWSPASTSTTSPTRSPRPRRCDSWTRAAPATPSGWPQLERDGFPSYTTSVGWLGYPDEKVRALTRQAYAEGWRAMKMKVGGADRRRRPPGRGSSATRSARTRC